MDYRIYTLKGIGYSTLELKEKFGVDTEQLQDRLKRRKQRTLIYSPYHQEIVEIELVSLPLKGREDNKPCAIKYHNTNKVIEFRSIYYLAAHLNKKHIWVSDILNGKRPQRKQCKLYFL